MTGWKDSKAAENEDHGVAALIGFIERRATISKDKHNTSKGFRQGAPVKIRNHSVNNDVLSIEVTRSDYAATIRLSGYEFAGAIITIESGARREGKEDDVDMSGSDVEVGPQSTAVEGAPGVAGMSEEERKQAMLAEVMKQTGMNETYARFCLEAGEWDWDRAGQLYVERREQLPAEAFV